jgi:UDP-N-acetylmuramate dehydrogenase
MEIQNNISLKRHNTFGIDAQAEYFAAFHSVENLRELLEGKVVAKYGAPSLVLGGGSNILLTGNVKGLVLKNDIPGIEKIDEDEQVVFIKVGAGVAWHQFVLYCLDHNYAGVENLALIPGSVGASPMQNIGAYGVEVKDVFNSLEAMHITEKKHILFDKEACGFGYRESVFKNKFRGQFIITAVTYRLNKVPVFNTSYGAIEAELQQMGVQSPSIQAVAAAVMNIRRSKLPDPAVIGNAGSFFKNPEISQEQFAQLQLQFPAIIGYGLPSGNTKLAAGWMIEQCGWKGYRQGDAGCHARQALVLVNYGNATGAQVYALSESIIDSVEKKFGVRLEREVNIV